MDERPKCKARNYKALRGKQVVHSDINHSNILFELYLMEIKTKIAKWDLIKSFFTAKEAINKTKRKLSEWKKIIANKKTDKGLISKMYKHLIQLNIRKTNSPTKNKQKT